MTTPQYPWDDLHHHSFFIPDEPSSSSYQFYVETKDFIHGSVDWFKNPISGPESFEEGNMASIFPTIQVNISMKPGIVKNNMIDASFPPKEATTYKTHFQEFRDVFTWSYTKIPRIDLSIVEHHIDTWSDVSPVR